jgi:outer membrane protein TolC
MKSILRGFAVGVLTIAPTQVMGEHPATVEPVGPADAIVASIADKQLRELLAETLDRNPGIAALEARVASATHRSVAVRKLPDPRAELTAFLLPPETRVGPQRAAARIEQQIPGGGKRDGAGHAAELERDALAAELEVLRLDLVTRTRSLAVELAYLDEARRVLVDDRTVLSHFEELARAQYAAGTGLQMDAVRIQAEMTRLDTRITAVDERRAAATAEINLLRDRSGEIVPRRRIEVRKVPELDRDALTALALTSRPELAASDARISRTAELAKLAARDRSPDYSVGLTYAWVDRRTDIDVSDNGQDVFGISGGITIPLWKKAVTAEVEAHTADRLSREAARRGTAAGIRREIEALAGTIPEIARRLDLLENVLSAQNEQALASAEAAYVAGRADALSLLEAERSLLDVRLSAARSRADLSQAYIELEGAIAAPLAAIHGSES